MMRTEVKGAADLAAALRALPQQIQGRELRAAVAAGAKVIRQEVVQRAPVWTGPVAKGHPPPGTLRRSIYQMWLRDASSATREVFMVSVRSGKGAAVRKGKNAGQTLDAYYWRWVEFGHYTRGRKGGKDRKGIASGSSLVSGSYYVLPRPFLRPGFEAKKQEAVQRVIDRLRDRLPAAIERARKRRGA